MANWQTDGDPQKVSIIMLVCILLLILVSIIESIAESQ